MTNKNIYKLLFLIAVPLFSACDDLFEPALENKRSIEAMWEEPSYAQGILANAYVLLPYQGAPNSDLATDDAVTNDFSNNYLRIATGSWAADNDPLSQWQNRYNAIQYINIMIENCDKVKWANTPVLNRMFRDHFMGESYALRALQMFYLLRAHAGYTNDGQLMGVQIHLNSEGASSDFNQPRATFKACVDQIISDLDSALVLLPYEDGDVASDNDVPAKYASQGGTMGEYNRAFGNHLRGKINGKVAEALRAQVALLAASPAYNADSGMSWAQAADYAAVVLDHIGGIGGIDANGWKWFDNHEEIDNLKAGVDPKEIVWRASRGSNNDLESNNYPPSLYGSGRVNPTQNLVDAFPMANGYPITDANSGYNADNPYADRDPRLAAYILLNESTIGSAGSTITTGVYGTNRDALNRESGSSTRTGYYLRKLLRSDINLDPSNSTTQNHYLARIRYTEIFLAYAEAANEAWGPTGRGSHGYSAYDVVKALRARAGVGAGNGDAYLESIKGNQDKMRELIRNERRLELCFENHRFYDLRRWKVDLSKLNETARGMEIDKNSAGTLTYKVLPKVEIRDFKEYMYYGPIPFSETRKWTNLEQNKGW